MARKDRKLRRLVVDGHVYLWRHHHTHHRVDGRATDCRQTLTLYPQPAGSGGPLRIVFAEAPGRYVPGGRTGSGDVGRIGGNDLNLHEPGAVRALLDVASARGWDLEARGVVEVDGWALLDAAAERMRSAGV